MTLTAALLDVYCCFTERALVLQNSLEDNQQQQEQQLLWRRRWSKLSYRYADTYIAAVYEDTYIAADIDMRTHI
jgi:hypothetical protein